MLNSSLYDRTLHLVKNRPVTVTFQVIADATGVKRSWIEAFASGRIPDPSVRKVETIYVFLSKKPLDFGGCDV